MESKNDPPSVIANFPSASELHLTIGPMFSGKTSALIHKAQSFAHAKISFVIFSPSKSNRHEHPDDNISSHSTLKHRAIYRDLLTGWNLDALANPKKINVVLIDEAQFFPDLKGCTQQMLEAGLAVWVYALNGDINLNIFPEIATLIPLASSVITLTSMCQCGKPAVAHRKTKGDPNQVVDVGGPEKYRVMCYSCWLLFSSVSTIPPV